MRIPSQSLVQYRIYACGEVVHEDDFEHHDNAIPYCDDFHVVYIPQLIVEHIESEALGK